MDRWIGRVALVTGASAGIGEAVVKDLVRHGMKVVGCARREDKLTTLSTALNGQTGKFYPRKCDLANEADIRSMFSWITSHPELGKVDVCINNAGLSTSETLRAGSMESWRTMLDVNVLALCLCTQLSVESMVSNKIDDGQIIMIGSMSGHRVPPNPSTRFYAASKFAVTGLLEGWRQELRDIGGNIRVCGISPGLVQTEFQAAMYPDSPDKVAAIHNSVPCLQSEDISGAVSYILACPPHMQVHDILMRPTQQKS